MSAKKVPSFQRGGRAATSMAADRIGARDKVAAPRLGLSVPEAAEAAGLSKRFMWDLVKNGKVRTRRIGKRVIVTVAALNEFLNAKN